MKRLLIILSAIFSFAGMQAQTTDGYLTNGDIVTIRFSYPGWNINNMYLQLSQQGISSIGYPDENCLWRLGIVENGNSYQYTFEHVATELYLRTQTTSALQTADIVTGNASNRTAFRFDCTERVKDSYLRGHLGCVIVIPSWGNTQVFACLTSTNGVLQFCPWNEFDVYIEKWTQSGSGDGTLKGYFSPELQKFGWAKDDATAREQAKNVKFVFPTHIHSSYHCVNRPDLVLGGSEAEITEFPTPTFYWKSQGKNGNKISVLNPARYQVPAGAPDIEGREMLQVNTPTQDANDKSIWNFTITPLNKSPKNLQRKDAHSTATNPIYRWVNYMDTLVAEYTYDGEDYTIYMVVERNSYHDAELPSLVISVNPHSYTFARTAETLDIQVTAVHQHGKSVLDIENNAVEIEYETGGEPAPISAINGSGWKTDLTIEYPQGTGTWITSAQVVDYNTIRVAVPEHNGNKRSAILKGTLSETDRHGHEGTFEVQLHQRGKEGGIDFKTQLGAGNKVEDHEGWEVRDPQPVHTAERTIYYTKGQQIELKLAESGFSGYMRWYDYETGGNPFYNDRHGENYPSTGWHTQPRSADGKWFVNINTPQNSGTVGYEGYSWGLYALNNRAKDKAGRQLTAAMGAILDETYKTNDRLAQPAPILYGWNYTYNASATTDDEKRLSGYHTMACDVSAYTDYEITTQENNTSRITHIKEPTLSYRQLFHLKPAEEIADKFAALKDGEYLEEYHYMAPVGPDVYLSTEFRHAAKQPETEKCYFYWEDGTKNGTLLRVDGINQIAHWYDESGNPITPGTYNAKDYLDVDAQSPSTKTYYLRVPNALGTGKHLNIAKFTVEFMHANACGPSAGLISMEQIRAQYKVLEYIDFSFGAPAPGTDNERALSKPLPWSYATYGFVYPSDINGDGNADYVRGDSQGEFPYFGEYRLVNKVNKNFGGDAGVSGENHGGAANGYAMYVDGTMEPGMVASISTNAVICSAQTMYCSMWLRNPSSTAHSGALPIFRCNIQGRKKTDQKDAKGNIIYTEWEDAGVFFVGSIAKNSGWRQIVFPINSANSYDETRVSLYNFATDNMANDFMIDDICLFVSQLPFAAYQGKMACRTTAESETHAVAVLRIDYSKIDKDNDGYMYYQVYNENLKQAVNLSGNAAYYHEAHQGEQHTGETYYGSVGIPDATFNPEKWNQDNPSQPKLKIYQSVTKFVDDLMVSGEKNGIAFVRINNDGVEKWLLYVGHIIENTAEINEANKLLYSGHNYTLRMAHTPNELDKAECNMQTPLHATQATYFQLDDSEENRWDEIHSTSYDHCANQLYFLTSKIKNSLALNAGGAIENLVAPIQSDWLVIYDTWKDIDVYAEAVPNPDETAKLASYNARLAIADTLFKKKYTYTRGQIANAILHDMRRIPTADDPNPNYYARSFKELDPNHFQTHANYQIIKHLCDNDWLQMHKTTTFFYLGAQDTARYLVYPIEGTAEAKMSNGTSVVLKDCKEERYVAISSMNWAYHLNATPIQHEEKTAHESMQLPTVKVLLNNIHNVQIPITDLFAKETYIKINGVEYNHESTITIDLSNLPSYMKYMNMTTGKIMNSVPTLEVGKEYTLRLQYNDANNNPYNSAASDKAVHGKCPVGYVFFHLLVIPNTLVWTPEGASFNGWGKDENWRGWIDNGDGVIADNELTEGYVPISGANVVIPNLENTVLYPYIVLDHEHNHYPMTIGFEPHHCKNIYFAPGAKLYNQHLLEYDTAFVDMQFTAAKWQMVSAPLQGMVSGDMFVPHNGMYYDNDASKIEEPNPFEVSGFQGIRHADAAYAFWEAFYESDVDGSNTLVRGFDNVTFTQSNSLIQPLNVGKGYMVYGLGHEDAEQLTVRLPKPDTEYYYYNEGKKDESSFVEITSTNRSKLAYTADHNQQDMTIQLTKKADSEYFLFGNPTMAFVDMHALYLDHQTQWTGEFKTMINGQFNASVQGTLSTADRYLPPMTSALLKASSEAATEMTITLLPAHLTLNNMINPAKASDDDQAGSQPQAAPARRIAGIDERPINYEALQSELMTIYAFTPKGTARTVLATNPAANDYYTSGEDALFTSTGVENESYVTTPLNMYTVAEQVPMMADVRQGISEIPLGILAASNARSEYMQVAFYLSSNWTRECYFCDSKTGQKIRIMDGLVISVEMPLNHEQRYYIEGPDTYQGSNGVVTSTTQPTLSTTGNKVWAYALDRGNVVVSSTDLIKSATLYDITGRLIAQSPNTLITNSLTLHTAGVAGVYIVDVTLRDGSTERAQVIVQ